jgi:hypothetical protein
MIKFTSGTASAFLLCLLIVPSVFALNRGNRPKTSVAGVYENFTVGKGSGDLEGMRVVIVPAGDGYYAIVQIAQGGAEDPKPEFVEAKVKGTNVTFAIGDEKYTATVTPAGLRVKSASDPSSSVLKRRPCSSYFRWVAANWHKSEPKFF